MPETVTPWSARTPYAGALAYGRLGVRVFPVATNAKSPLIPREDAEFFQSLADLAGWQERGKGSMHCAHSDEGGIVALLEHSPVYHRRMPNIEFERHDLRWFLEQEPERFRAGGIRIVSSFPVGSLGILRLFLADSVTVAGVQFSMDIVVILAVPGTVGLLAFGLYFWLVPLLNWWNRDRDRFRALAPLVKTIQGLQVHMMFADGVEGTQTAAQLSDALGELRAKMRGLGLDPAPLTYAAETRDEVLATLGGLAAYGKLEEARTECERMAETVTF